jgi:hypothetical protein
MLPPGDYELTLDELRESRLVTGSPDYPNWDAVWRRHLVDNLGLLVVQLWRVGITEVFIDGSFVEDKDHPNDIDGYFVCDLRRFASGEIERELNLLDPSKAWTWDPTQRRPYRGYPKKQLPCGIATASSFTRTTASSPEFATNMATSSSFPLRFGSPDATGNRAASSKLEAHHDPQRE